MQGNKIKITWIDKQIRMPTKEDADAHGTILAYHRLNGVILSTPRVFAQYGTYLTHWAPMPEPPKERVES